MLPGDWLRDSLDYTMLGCYLFLGIAIRGNALRNGGRSPTAGPANTHNLKNLWHADRHQRR